MGASSGAMQLRYSKHARHVMRERGIPVEWVEQVVASVELRVPDPVDSQVERFFGRIPERGGRVLRVAVNTRAVPWRVVSVFFDRSMRGEL